MITHRPTYDTFPVFFDENVSVKKEKKGKRLELAL